MMWTLSQASAKVGGRVQGADVAFDAVGTDGRVDCTGQLFVALEGERWDGHDFVPQALERGAVAALVARSLAVAMPQWIVEDTRLALGRLAGAWRDRFGGRIVAVTGSNGKTTCKEMIAAILSEVGSVRATRGNLNNDIGMPLTLLAARDENHLVLEMGANHAGEIHYLSTIARPGVAVITNAGRAHLEGFGSLEGVARAKGEIADGLPADGAFVVPFGSPWTSLWRECAAGRRLMTFGTDAAADVGAPSETVTTGWDASGFRTRFEVALEGVTQRLELQLAGMHNVRNALAAIAVAHALGIAPAAIADGLAKVRPVAGRLDPRSGTNGARVIDDSYNANPDSVAAAIDVLVSLSGRHWLILGDLAELGEHAAGLHADLGRMARSKGVDRLYATGNLCREAVAAFGDGAVHFAEQGALSDALLAECGAADCLLVKGSRSAAMDRVVAALCGGEDRQ